MDQEHSALGAPRGDSVPAPIRAFGARRINLEMRVRLDEADKFTGLPHGTAKRFEILAAFEQAEPYLGLPSQASKLVAWLVRQTQDQDWEQGSRPIAWPSAERQAEFLGGMSLRAVQLLNRRLWEAGIFVMRDDPQGRRYGHRDKRTGRVTKAFGFDLSPLALRCEEFKKVAVDAQIERNRMSSLRRRPEQEILSPSKLNHLFPESLQITPATLLELAPRLAPYMPPRYDDKTWSAIVDAALFLSGEMGINSTLWARACDVMGRPYAAVAIAIVSTRPAGHFTSGPGGYFAGMLRKFEKNPADLCLNRTLYRLKTEAWGKEGYKQRQAEETRKCRG
jgi:hypothetical protein